MLKTCLILPSFSTYQPIIFVTVHSPQLVLLVQTWHEDQHVLSNILVNWTNMNVSFSLITLNFH